MTTAQIDSGEGPTTVTVGDYANFKHQDELEGGEITSIEYHNGRAMLTILNDVDDSFLRSADQCWMELS